MHTALKSWIAAVLLLFASVSAAAPTYWNVFNIEGESDLDAAIVTYATLQDMLNDENRTGLYTPDGSGIFGVNVVDSGSDGTTYWNLFNIEGESDLDAAIVTYATLLDMLNDENRTGLYTPDGSGLFGVNIVDSGSNGTTYWNLFNIEGESDLDAAFVTYATLADMLNDENRTGLYVPDGSGIFGVNIVGGGFDGSTYWNVFNIEGESDLNAAIVTYATLLDMLNDENRTGLYTPDGSGLFGVNIVGGGFGFDAVTTVPEPRMAWLLLLALGAMHIARQRSRPGPSL